MKMNKRNIGLLILLTAVLTAALLLCACTGGKTPGDTTAQTDPVTDPATDSGTVPETDAPTDPETVPATEPETETEPVTEPVLWTPDTGVFNEGKVVYEPIWHDDGYIMSATAVPTEGNRLGLDITDRTDLISICYSVWFDAILGTGTNKIENWYNITEIQEGKQSWGPVPQFHYWAKPAQGYYRSSDPEAIRNNMTMLYEAGVDFIILDLTNAGPGYLDGDQRYWKSYIQIPVDAMCDTILAMRAEGKGTPYMVFWVGGGSEPSDTRLYQALYDRYLTNENWKDCFVFWNDKPFLLTTHTYPADFPLKDLFTVRRMWGLQRVTDVGSWNYLNVYNYGLVTNDEEGKPEQISVAVAAQETYMSRTDTAHPRDNGIFWYCQWTYAFEVHPKVVTLCWWNEWVAQRLQMGDEYVFTDEYDMNYSRDIEPMEGGHGDMYYQFLKQYVSYYKSGLPCPELVKEGYEAQLARRYKQYMSIAQSKLPQS